MNVIEPVVDAVITWVDGTDPAHEKKLIDYLAIHGLERQGSAAPTRFNACGELDYCLRSILYFAPWVRTIHVVTDGQVPAILELLRTTDLEHKIKLVDHRVLFQGFEDYLPTFNSLSIESMLWRIPHLANQFIYFNDDCFLIQPVDYHDFFVDGKPVIRGSWKTHSEKKWRAVLRRAYKKVCQRPNDSLIRMDHRGLQERSACSVGFKRRFFHLPHLPFSMRMQTFADFIERHPNWLAENAQYALRHVAQCWAISLAYHLEIRAHQMHRDRRLISQNVHAEHHPWPEIMHRLRYADRHLRVAFICIQSLDEGSPEIRSYILQWLDKRIPSLKALSVARH